MKQRPETVEKLERDIAVQREMIARATRIVQGLKGNDGWEAAVENFKERLEAIESELDGYNNLTDKGRDHALCQRVETRNLISLVEDHEQIIEMVAEEMQTNIADLNERKQRLRLAQ